MPGESQTKQQHILFAGNPGAGKSTLMNCLMSSAAKRPLGQNEKFQSGISLGSGMTYQLDKKTVEDIVYMDTPGLSDIDKRKEAAEAITKALKQDGEYQIVFVVTLEAGRVRPDDVTTITLVLESAKEITGYGIVFNKLGKSVKDEIDVDPMAMISKISLQKEEDKRLPIPFTVELSINLYDKENATTDVPGLTDFIKAIPSIVVHQGKVQEIRCDQFEIMKIQFERQISVLMEQNDALKIKMEEDRKYFRTRIDAMEEDQKGWLSTLEGIGPYANYIGKVLRKII